MKKEEQLTGIIEDITYHNTDNGFTVICLSVEGEELTVVGELVEPGCGEELQCTGYYTTHPVYGRQFKTTCIQRILPSSASAILRYLSGRTIKGVGPATARRIVDAFGDDTLTIMETSPERLAEIKGISPKKAEEIGIECQRLFGLRSIMLVLAGYGIHGGTAIAVWKRYGGLTREIVETNPYLLCDEELGVSFEKADEIAGKLGFNQEDPCRIQGGLLYVLRFNQQNGHCCLPLNKLLSAATNFLQIDAHYGEDQLQVMVEDHSLVMENYMGKPYVYLPETFESECFSAGRLCAMLHLSYQEKAVSEKDIARLEQELSITYADAQRKALIEAANHSVLILTGGPGTGKTTTLNGILKLFEQRGLKVSLAAPTGRAAKRLSELTGREAKTIHRLLEVDFGTEAGALKFKRNQQNPLQVDAVVVDEMSMVDIRLFDCLLRAIKLGSKLIMVGDPDQLPSVGPGNVLKDLIASEMVPTVNLNRIFRQAAESQIIVGAHDIVSGELPDLSRRDSDFFFLPRQTGEEIAQTVSGLVSQRLPTAYGLSPIADIQVICPTKQGIIGTTALNALLQQQLNPPSAEKSQIERFGQLYREGDKVMQIRNNYDIIWTQGEEEGMGVFNGDIGIIDLIDRPSQSVLVRFEDKIATYSFDMLGELDLSYGITVHKSQGNEFEAVVIPLMGSHPRLYYRNLLYTAVTRAKKLLVIVGHQQSIAVMVGTNNRTKRYTNLANLIQTEGVDQVELES